MTSSSRAECRFSKLDVSYIAKYNEYHCPAAELAVFRFATIESGLTIRNDRSSACPRCPLKTQCTIRSDRRSTRREHERILEEMQHWLDRKPKAMLQRRRTIEHVLGTLKHWISARRECVEPRRAPPRPSARPLEVRNYCSSRGSPRP
jgi:adenine-specific DNA glycosylase